ncbi:MAG: delta-60 repeat domain-containing protein [Verrucomicrobiota bacterium]
MGGELHRIGLAAALSLALPVSAADFGGVDPTFAPDLGFGPGLVSYSTFTPSGQVLVAGDFHRVNGIRRTAMARLNGDGTLDAGFGTPLSTLSWLQQMACLSDGKVVIRGDLISTNGHVLPPLIRLNADGGLDPSFALPEDRGLIYGFRAQPDGKLLITGLLFPTNNVAQTVLARLNADGSRDESFRSAVVSGGIQSLAIDPGGRVLIAGSELRTNVPAIWPSSEPPLPPLLRLNANGGLDDTFRAPEGLEPWVVVVNSVGQTFVSESVFSRAPAEPNPAIWRLLEDGSKDPTYSTSLDATGRIFSLLPLADGKLIVEGLFGDEADDRVPSLLRLDAHGTVEQSYDLSTSSLAIASGGSGSGRTSAVLIDNSRYSALPDGTVLTPQVARLLPGGVNDPTFEPQISRVNEASIALAVVPTESILVTHYVLGGDGFRRKTIRRIELSGVVDSSFAPALGTTSAESVRVAVDGSILTLAYAGITNWSAGITNTQVLRLDHTGDRVSAWPPVGEQPFYFNWTLLPDGKVMVAFPTLNDSTTNGRPLLVRYLASGQVDPSFDNANVFSTNSYVSKVFVAPDGRPLLQGYFNDAVGEPMPDLVRLLPDGSLDPTFMADSSSSSRLELMACQADGRLLLASFRFVVSVSVGDNQLPMPSEEARIARLHVNGSLDAGFQVSFGPQSRIQKLVVQRDGKILVAGRLYDMSGQSVRTLVRLLPDGSEDLTFNLSGGEIAPVTDMAVQRDGNILVGGAFDRIGGIDRSGMARLFSIEQPAVNDFSLAGSVPRFQLSGNLGRTWLIQSSTDLVNWTTVKTVTISQDSESVELPVTGDTHRFYRAVLAP